jgi:hypothetical protein
MRRDAKERHDGCEAMIRGYDARKRRVTAMRRRSVHHLGEAFYSKHYKYNQHAWKAKRRGEWSLSHPTAAIVPNISVTVKRSF